MGGMAGMPAEGETEKGLNRGMPGKEQEQLYQYQFPQNSLHRFPRHRLWQSFPGLPSPSQYYVKCRTNCGKWSDFHRSLPAIARKIFFKTIAYKVARHLRYSLVVQLEEPA